MTGTFKLADSATARFTAGAGFANGTIALGAGTTLEYTNSGNTLSLPCNSLTLPSSGTATLRINGDKLNFGDHVILASVTAGSADHLTVDPYSAALDGHKCKVVEKNGNLVLKVTGGLTLIFK